MSVKKPSSVALTDGSMNVQLNPVRLPDGSIVPWAVAFPRP
jgi:hypothetical protein